MFQQRSGQDVTGALEVLAKKDAATIQQNSYCIQNLFYAGTTDFRDTPKMYVSTSSPPPKFLIGMFGSPRCAVAYPQKEPRDAGQIRCLPNSSLYGRRRFLTTTIDSLSALRYDDKRKLLFIICDGLIIGGGNEKPMSRIVPDILGVDPKLDPEPLLFKSVGEGDSQVLLVHYLNRVHFDAPLELENYHQMRNVIGIDPAFYECIFTVNADTVSRTHLITAAAPL